MLRLSKMLCAILLVQCVQAQLQTPGILEKPYFDLDNRVMALDRNVNPDMEEVFEKRSASDGPWLVFTDRVNVQLFKDKKMKTPAKVIATLGTMFMVQDETDDMVEVSEKGNEVGWIKKSDLVLWQRPLMKPLTQVDVKAFIVNMKSGELIDEIIKDIELKDVYKIYGAPGSATVLDRKQIYQILFVYKYDAANQRYLLSNNYKLDGNGQLLGWVSQSRTKVWDTALALEPNWDPAAIAERQSNSSLLAKVFQKSLEAGEYRKGTAEHKELVCRDPANDLYDEYSDMIFEGRFAGDIPRFPYFSETRGVIECGVIGKMSPQSTTDWSDDFEMANLRQRLDRMEKNKQDINVVFQVDGTRGMKRYVDKAVPAAVDAIVAATPAHNRSRLKFGLLVYSDFETCGAKPENVILKTIELTNDHDGFKKKCQFFSNAGTEFHQDDYVASRHGLYQALRKCGMVENQSNIIFHLGRGADVSQNRMRALTCRQLPFIDDNLVLEEFFIYKPHMVSIQVEKKDQNAASANFFRDEEYIMGEAARHYASEIKEVNLGKEEVDIYLVDSEDKGYKEFANAHTLMRMYPSPKDFGEKTSPEEVVSMVVSAYESCLERRDQTINAIRSLYMDDSTVGKMATQYTEVAKAIFADLPSEYLELLTAERVQMFSPGYTYAKHDYAEQPINRHVLFLKKRSVNALQKFFREIENAADSGDDEDKKRSLELALEEYAKSILNLNEEEFNESQFTLEDLRNQVTGVKGFFDNDNSMIDRLTAIGEIDALPSSDVKSIYDMLRVKGQRFNEEVGGDYPFIYKAGIAKNSSAEEMEFYWIPIEYLF